jgi:hypothetical protein
MIRMKNKYSAKKCVIDGYKFDSLAEGEYYQELKLFKMRGDIVEILPQPKVYLTTARILYKPDFKIKDKFDRVWYVDVKGMQTPVFRLKAKLWRHYGDAPLRLVKKTSKGFTLIEEILSTQGGL